MSDGTVLGIQRCERVEAEQTSCRDSIISFDFKPLFSQRASRSSIVTLCFGSGHMAYSLEVITKKVRCMPIDPSEADIFV